MDLRIVIIRVAMVVGILILALLGLKYEKKINAFLRPKSSNSVIPDVTSPTIINGELVLPKITTGKNSDSQLLVNSANLIPIFDQPSAAQSLGGAQPAQKIVGLQILGEITNAGNKIVTGVSPILKFYDKDGKMIGQKIGDLSSGFNFFPITPGEKTLYSVSILNPPDSDKMEILMNTEASTTSATIDGLNVIDQAIEVKTAKYHNNNQLPISNDQKSTTSGEVATQSGEATASGGPAGSEGEMVNQGTGDTAGTSGVDQIDYFTVTGSVLNTFADPITEITIFAWVKDSEGHVFSVGRQDFKNDLISPKEKVDFRINLLPFRIDQKYATYEVKAWGKRYRLGI